LSQEENKEEVVKNYENIEKITNLFKQITEIIANDKITDKGKSEELEKLRINLREEYREFLKKLTKNKTLLNILNKISNNEIINLDKNTITIFDTMLNKYKEIEKIITIFENISSNISTDITTNIARFIFKNEKLTLIKIAIRRNAYEEALKIYMPDDPDYDELIIANKNRIQYIDDLETLYYKFDNYISSTKHILAQY